MAKQAAGQSYGGAAEHQGRPHSFGGKRFGRGGLGTGMSVADQNFGVNAQSILPNVNENQSMLNAKMSEPFSANGSFLDAKSQSTGPQTTTSDILFLKRLLFLKAALDNEASTSNFAVPFDEDKAFRLTAQETTHMAH